MEESKQLSTGVSSLEVFINEQRDVSIPQHVLKRFIFDVQHEDYWYQSDKVYDEWFNKYYTRYAKFIDGMKKELVEEADYKLVTPDGDTKRMNTKTLYLISYQGLTRLEMKCDKETRIYHTELKRLFGVYMKKQVEKSKKELLDQIKAKDEEIKRLKHPNPESVYYIRNSDTNELLYIGRDLSKRQRRYLEHLTGRSQVLSGKHSLIDTYLATMDIQKIVFEYKKLLPGEAEQFELDEITRLNPRFNISGVQNEFKCPCHPQRPPYKGYMAYHKHMEKMHQQISEDSKVDIESDTESETDIDSDSEYEPETQ